MIFENALSRQIDEASSTPEWARYEEKRNELYKLRDDRWDHERVGAMIGHT
jgi:hypothetical protein